MIPYIPIVQGILFGFAPNFLLLFFLSLAMLGGFWGFGFFECIEITSDGICESSFIEKFGVSSYWIDCLVISIISNIFSIFF